MTTDELNQLRVLLYRLKSDPNAPEWVDAPANQVLQASSVMLDSARTQG